MCRLYRENAGREDLFRRPRPDGNSRSFRSALLFAVVHPDLHRPALGAAKCFLASAHDASTHEMILVSSRNDFAFTKSTKEKGIR